MKIKFDYGVYKCDNASYQAKFYDIEKQENKYIGIFNNEEEAKIAYSKYEFNFYKEKKYLLPKGIAIDFKRECFIYAVYFDGKTIIQKRFPTIKLCVKYRDELLKTIIG